MTRGRLAAALFAIGLVVFFAVTWGPPAPTPNPPGTFSFAVLGDAPYYPHEEVQFRVVIKDLNQHELASVIHIGDLFWRPCSDAMYVKARGWLASIRHPVIYTPGDNEWIDCWEPRVGGYDPLERLAQLRKVFFSNPTRSLGGKPIALESQKELAENARWRHGSLIFATVHLIGSKNGLIEFPGRTPAYDAESRQRTAADAAWLRETFAEAKAVKATAVVIGFHANPAHWHRDPEYWPAFEPFLSTLEAEARQFASPVLVVQGDSHEFIVDHPLPGVPNLTRMQVPGSYDVGWVRVNVKPESGTFTFESRVVPRWKYW